MVCRLLLPLALAASALPAALAASVPCRGAVPTDCNVEVSLKDATARTDDSRHDLDLELQVRGGEWQADWVRGRGLNQGRHTGRLTSARTVDGETQLAVEMRLKPDMWIGGGKAAYAITLRPMEDGRTFEGAYKGTFTFIEEPKPTAPRRRAPPAAQAERQELSPEVREFLKQIGAKPAGRSGPADEPEVAEGRTVEVSGTVTGRVRGAWPVPVPGHRPVEPGEHPRLIFRRADVETLRRRAETPEGKAIMARFMQVIDYTQHDGSYKFDSWPGIGFGFAWQMTGEKKWADRARALVEEKFFRRGPVGGQDIHHAPQLQGLALTFDLCYDAWDDPFRQKCIDEIWQRTQECDTGTINRRTMGGTNWAYWSNHNGIRAAGAGLGALAIWGETDASGHTFDADVLAIADEVAYDQRGWLHDGCGGGQWFMEGVFYKGMTMVRGLSHFLHAYAEVTGKRTNASGPPPKPVSNGWGLRDELIVGYFLEAEPGKLFGKLSGIDADSLEEVIWTIGLGEVPPEAMPGVKYLMARKVGLQGDRTFGLDRACYGPYLMAGYPFDVQEKHPAECFPWVSPDVQNGHWVFRNTWRDGDDVLLTWNLLSGVRGSCHHERVGEPQHWQLWGLGQRWLDGRYHPAVKGKEKCLGEQSGLKTLRWSAPEERLAILVQDVAPAYMTPLKKQRGSTWDAAARQAGAHRAAFVEPWRGGLGDFGIRGTRRVAVDLSGKSGAPLLLVIAEDLSDRASADAEPQAARFTWKLPLDTKGGSVEVADNVFRFTKGDAVMSGVVLGGGPLSATDASTEVEGGKLLAVLVIHKGAGPKIDVKGTAALATVRVGRRTVRLSRERLIVE